MSSTRPLPNSLEAEKALLGNCLCCAESLPALDVLTPGDFYSDRNRLIARTISRMRDEKKAVDLVTVTVELQRTGEIEKAGGVAYVTSIPDSVPVGPGKHTEEYSKIIKEKSLLRKIFHLANKVAAEASEVQSAPEEILDGFIKEALSLVREDVSAQHNGVSYQQAAKSLIRSLDRQGGPRIFSGVQSLDDLTGGFRPGELILFTAETGVGKTLLAQQVRQRACRDGHHSLFASAEMSAEHLVSREVATQAEVSHWKMRRPERITPEEIKRIVEATKHQCLKCRILDGELHLSRIAFAARRLKAEGRLDLLVIDYDELVEVPGKDEMEQQRNLVRGAKGLAVELSCSVILVSQLRKLLQGEDRRRPTLQRLYGSGAKAKHPSLIIYVDREYVRELRGEETSAQIAVLKNRDGRIGMIEAYFNVKALRFESVAEREPEEVSVP